MVGPSAREEPPSLHCDRFYCLHVEVVSVIFDALSIEQIYNLKLRSLSSQPIPKERSEASIASPQFRRPCILGFSTSFHHTSLFTTSPLTFTSNKLHHNLQYGNRRTSN